MTAEEQAREIARKKNNERCKRWVQANREKANAYQRKYYAALPEEEKERRRQLSRDYYYANRERVLAAHAEKYRQNPEAARERSRDYYKRHPETVKAAQKRYRAKNQEKLNAQNLARYYAKKQAQQAVSE